MVFGFRRKKRQDRKIADSLYNRIVEASRQPVFFARLGVPDTLDGRFEMLSLHMFIALDRLVESGASETALARTVMESFVRDMDAALRDMGVSDIRVPKRMKTLYGSFGGRIAGYRLAASDGGEALHAALARNIFSDGGDPDNVVGLADYTLAALGLAGRFTIDDLRAGRIEFPEAARFCSLERGMGEKPDA